MKHKKIYQVRVSNSIVSESSTMLLHARNIAEAERIAIKVGRTEYGKKWTQVDSVVLLGRTDN